MIDDQEVSKGFFITGHLGYSVCIGPEMSSALFGCFVLLCMRMKLK